MSSKIDMLKDQMKHNEEKNMKKYWFTFGFNQGHDNCYVIIEAESWDKARERMIEVWGHRWGFQYMSAASAGVERFNLQEIK